MLWFIMIHDDDVTSLKRFVVIFGPNLGVQVYHRSKKFMSTVFSVYWQYNIVYGPYSIVRIFRKHKTLMILAIPQRLPSKAERLMTDLLKRLPNVMKTFGKSHAQLEQLTEFESTSIMRSSGILILWEINIMSLQGWIYKYHVIWKNLWITWEYWN